jgi:ATP-dependent Zn protease
MKMNDWMALAASWLPFLVLIGLWLWLSRKSGMQARGKSGTTMIELYEQQVAESQRMNVMLERIAVSLEKRESSSSSRT